MLMMRLQRVGRRNDPSYRVVVTDKRTGPKSNKHVAILGSYNPKLDHIQIDGEQAKLWLSKGVQPSPTVHNILVTAKVLDAKKLNVLPKKSPIVDEAALAAAQEEAEKKAAEEAAANVADNETDTPAESEANDSAETADETTSGDDSTEVEPEPAPEKATA